MSLDQPEVRYCMADDGVRLAYYVMGDGPPLVMASGFPSHLTATWAIPGLPERTRRFAVERKVVAYDARGMGLSQRVLDFSIDTRVADLRAVVRHLGLDSFAILGGGHASPLALAYAARYRQDVTHLILAQAYADGPRLYQSSKAFAAFAALEPVTVEQWDFVAATIGFRFAGFDGEAASRQAEMVKACISAEGYIAYRRDNRLTSVTAELGSITAPTLVIKNEDDDSIPLELSQEIAAAIPGARLHMANSSSDPLGGPAETELVLDFLRPHGSTAPPLTAVRELSAEPLSTIRAVLFTDLVSHSEMMSRLGDERGRAVLREHEDITRDILKQHGGTEVKTMGDGFMASFGSVTKAVECAIALQRAFAEREGEPLAVRVGLNAGEPIEEDGDLFGATVILASRIAARAGAGEILVSDNVRSLSAGKGFRFADRGEFVAKGFQEPVRVYVVTARG